MSKNLLTGILPWIHSFAGKTSRDYVQEFADGALDPLVCQKNVKKSWFILRQTMAYR
jgi:hypothetical protein